MALGWNFPGGGFAFVRFFFFLIRFGQPGKEATLQVFFLSLSLSCIFIPFCSFPFVFLGTYIFFCFFFVSDLLVLETPPGQSAERFSAPCELAVRPWPIRNEPDDGGLCVCVQRTASDGVMTRDWMQNFLDESATVSEIVPVHLLLTNSWLN